MISQRQSDAHAREPGLRPVPTGAPELVALTTTVRGAVRRLPSPGILTAEQRTDRGAGLAAGTGDAHPRSRDLGRVRGHPGTESEQLFELDDVGRIGSSVRRYYDLPLQPSRPAA